MPATIFMNTVTAAFASLAVAAASYAGVHSSAAYSDGALTKLSQAEVATHAQLAFQRADRNDDGVLDVNEFAAMSVVTAELANLNGFISVEKAGAVQTIALPVSAPLALGDAEQTRIDAVARHTFYAFAGTDGKMQQGEYTGLQNAIFASSDLNANGALTRAELSIYAQRQAYLRPNA
ncbi:hypothetical protein [Hyphococcus sp.]|uniref:hypothetical protein n=1 Tax=Hyphococcus sp. TaxID=2038636 RepID=UPI00208B105A|nr:MAG: hypothetical protein DHS20C04_13110 [Marinicaulis sp.]